MSFGKVGEFDERVMLVRKYLIGEQNKAFDLKEIRYQNSDYFEDKGVWSNKMADEFMLKWKLAKMQKRITEVPEEAVLALIKAVPDATKRQEIWNQWKSVGLEVSRSPITGESISKPQPSSSAGDNAPAVGPRQIQWRGNEPRRSLGDSGVQ